MCSFIVHFIAHMISYVLSDFFQFLPTISWGNKQGSSTLASSRSCCLENRRSRAVEEGRRRCFKLGDIGKNTLTWGDLSEALEIKWVESLTEEKHIKLAHFLVDAADTIKCYRNSTPATATATTTSSSTTATTTTTTAAIKTAATNHNYSNHNNHYNHSSSSSSWSYSHSQSHSHLLLQQQLLLPIIIITIIITKTRTTTN